MCSLWRCPECGAAFTEPVTCPACLAETTPDTLHRSDSHTVTLLTSDELTGPQRAIDAMLRGNRGCCEGENRHC